MREVATAIDMISIKGELRVIVYRNKDGSLKVGINTKGSTDVDVVVDGKKGGSINVIREN